MGVHERRRMCVCASNDVVYDKKRSILKRSSCDLRSGHRNTFGGRACATDFGLRGQLVQKKGRLAEGAHPCI